MSLPAVDKQRWREAQAWQLRFWQRHEQRRGVRRVLYRLLRPFLLAVESKRATGDDSNLWWREQFDAYGFLPHRLGDMIELGCGPYTNTRLIVKGRDVRRVVCSDPLADDYLQFRDRWLARAARAGVVEVDSHAIEDCPFPDGSFDVVVLIDVLDYVMDPELCLRTATRLLRPGGHFVFGQDFADVETPTDEWFAEGHPIRLTRADVKPFLAMFDPILEKVLDREHARNPGVQAGALVFAGRKRPS